MRFLTYVFLFFMIVLTFQAFASNSLTVEKSYAFATSEKQKNGAVFFILHNHTDQHKRVVGAETDMAEVVELHTHDMSGDVMMMRPVEFYEVPANGVLTLEPMGHHIMLMGLKDTLVKDNAFPLTLIFDDGERVMIDVQVRTPGDVP